jgi:hypothetical protein
MTIEDLETLDKEDALKAAESLRRNPNLALIGVANLGDDGPLWTKVRDAVRHYILPDELFTNSDWRRIEKQKRA